MALPNFWDQFLAAIRAQESGGNYSEDTAGCLGAYCWSAQSNWDTMAKAAGETKYIGTNPSQVPPAIQDKVASSNLYRIYQQSHSLKTAAMWWNGGSTSSVTNPGLSTQPWAKSCGGGTSAAYACQVLQRMSLGGHYLAGSGAQSGAGGVVTTAAGIQADCAISLPIPGLSFNFNPIGGSFGPHATTNKQCILSKSQARAVLGVLTIILGANLLLAGFALTVVMAGPGRRIIQLVMPVVKKAGAAPKATAPAPASAPAT